MPGLTEINPAGEIKRLSCARAEV